MARGRRSQTQLPTRTLTALSFLVFVTCTEPSSAPVADPVPPQEGRLAPDPQETPTASRTPQTPEMRSRSSRAALRWVELSLVAGVMEIEGLRIQVAFENVSDTSYGLAGDLGGTDFRLENASGSAFSPVFFAPRLDPIDASEGFPPGAKNSGQVQFPPPGDPPYKLTLPSYSPIEFTLVDLRGLNDTALLPTEDPDRTDLAVAADRTAMLREEPKPDTTAEDDPSSHGERNARAELKTLLDAQADAIRRFEVNDYLETFVDQRQRRETLLFQHLQLVPFAEYRLYIDPGTRLAPYKDTGLQAQVELIYLFEGMEDNPFVLSQWYSFLPTAGGIKVDTIRNKSKQPLFWRQNKLAVHHTPHFLIYSSPRHFDELLEVAKDAEAAYAVLYQRGLPVAPRSVLHVITDRYAFEGMLGAADVLGAALARYTALGGSIGVDSRMFYLNGALFARSRRRPAVAEAQRVTVTHELVHLALAMDSRPYTPPWLREGTAVYFSDDVDFDLNRELVREGLDQVSVMALTQAQTLGEHDTEGGKTAREYLFSGDVVAYLVETYGEDRFFEFFRSYAKVPVNEVMDSFPRLGVPSRIATATSGVLSSRLTERALQAHFQTTIEELDAAVKDWLWLRHR